MDPYAPAYTGNEPPQPMDHIMETIKSLNIFQNFSFGFRRLEIRIFSLFILYFSYLKEIPIEYDVLQQLYLSIGSDTNYAEMIELVQSTGLFVFKIIIKLLFFTHAII